MTTEDIAGAPSGATRGAPATDTRGRLIAAARDVFCEVGLKQARMEDIAARAGVSRAAVYYHFNTKGDLAAAIADDVFQRLTVAIRAALADGPLDGVIAATVRFFAEHVALARLLISEAALPTDHFHEFARHRDVMLDLLRRRIAADIAAGRVRSMDPDVAAQAVVSVMRAAPIEMICNEGADKHHLTAQLTEFLRHAIAPTP